MFRAKLTVVGFLWALSAGCGGGSSARDAAGTGGTGTPVTGGAIGTGGALSGSGGSVDAGGQADAPGAGGLVDSGRAGAPGTGGSVDRRDAAGTGGSGPSFDAGAPGTGGSSTAVDASGTGGAAPGTGGATSQWDAADATRTNDAIDGGTGAGGAGSPGGTCFTWKVSPDLFVNSIGWQGWAWARSGGGSTISAIDVAPDGALCVSGTVAAAGDGVFAGVGFDLDYPRSASGATMRALTGKGVSYRIRNTGASPLVIKLNGPDAATDINNEWCRPLAASSGALSDTLTYSMLTPEDCGRGSKVTSGYLRGSVLSVSVGAAPAIDVATPFSYCVESITEFKPVECFDESNTLVPIAGATWTRRGITERWVTVTSSADGMKLVAGSCGSGGLGDYLYTSTDRGVTWTQRGPKQPWTSVASSADGSKLVAGTCRGFLYTSTDSGVTWTSQGQGAPSSSCWSGVASSVDGVKLVAVSSSLKPSATFDGGYIYTSTDSGLTWTQRATPQETWTAVASSADGTRLVAAQLHGNLFASADSGETWTLVSTEAFISLAMSPDGLRIVGGGNNTTDYLYASSDFGATWTQMASPQPSWNGVAMSSDGTRMLAAVGQDTEGALHLSKDSGLTWTSPDPVYVSHRWWAAVASSNDGRSLVAVLDTDRIYTSSGALLP